MGDTVPDVLANRRRLSEALGIDLSQVVMPELVHGSAVQVVTPELRGAGSDAQETAIARTDVLITEEADVMVCVQGADCAPILFYDPERRVTGAVHAG